MIIKYQLAPTVAGHNLTLVLASLGPTQRAGQDRKDGPGKQVNALHMDSSCQCAYLAEAG